MTATGATPAIEPQGGSDTADITLAGVRKTYGDVVAVDCVDLEIRRGEFFTMLGPSGSGKTTCLRMIAGFERPDAGTIELAGRGRHRLPPNERDVNTVFQDYALFPHMSVGQQRRLRAAGQAASPRAERDARVEEALEMVRLEGFDDRRPGQLSGGQRQRVALARALVNRPARAAARRAAGRARPEAAPAAAGRAQAHPAGGRDHLHLRHPRPGRGALDERSHRGHGRRPHPADRARRNEVYDEPALAASSPASSASRTCSSSRSSASRAGVAQLRLGPRDDVAPTSTAGVTAGSDRDRHRFAPSASRCSTQPPSGDDDRCRASGRVRESCTPARRRASSSSSTAAAS